MEIDECRLPIERLEIPGKNGIKGRSSEGYQCDLLFNFLSMYLKAGK
jgi:hypothetical protein